MIELSDGDASVKVVADSISFGKRITTLELGYPAKWDSLVLECRMMSRTLVGASADHVTRLFTATEWQHWVEHEDVYIADLVQSALDASEPTEITGDDWHLPYYKDGQWLEAGDGKDFDKVSLEEAQAISAATIKHGDIDDKGLFEAMRADYRHYGYFEHLAKPMGLRAINMTEEMEIVFDEGVTHFDRKGVAWSGNFRDWTQLRKMGSFND